jgi:hypothetical protein
MEQLQEEAASCVIHVLVLVGSSTSDSLCAFFDNKYVPVIQILAHSIEEPLGSVHKRRAHTKAVQMKEFKRNTCVSWSIYLVVTLSQSLIEWEQCPDIRVLMG